MCRFASALDLYLKIVLTLRVDPRLQSKLNTAYRAVGWGLPALLLVIALALQAFGGSEGVQWCFFSGASSETIEWMLYYYPSVTHATACKIAEGVRTKHAC